MTSVDSHDTSVSDKEGNKYNYQTPQISFITFFSRTYLIYQQHLWQIQQLSTKILHPHRSTKTICDHWVKVINVMFNDWRILLLEVSNKDSVFLPLSAAVWSFIFLTASHLQELHSVNCSVLSFHFSNSQKTVARREMICRKLSGIQELNSVMEYVCTWWFQIPAVKWRSLLKDHTHTHKYIHEEGYMKC